MRYLIISGLVIKCDQVEESVNKKLATHEGKMDMRVFKTIPTILQVNIVQLFSKRTSTPFLAKHS